MVLASAGASLAALVLGAVLLRRDIAHWVVERGVSSQIPGDLVLGEVSEAGWAHVTAHDLEFRTPAGEPVIALDEAEVHLDLAALMSGNIEIERARVVGGEVRIEEMKDGSVELERAFSSPSDAGDSGKGPLIDVRSVQFADLEVHLSLQGVPTFEIRDVAGALRVRRPPGKAVRLRLERIGGVIREPDVLEGFELTRLDGFVHAQVEHVVHLESHASWSGKPARLGIDYYDRAKPRVKLSIEADALSKSMFAGLGLRLAEGFVDVLDVELSVTGL